MKQGAGRKRVDHTRGLPVYSRRRAGAWLAALLVLAGLLPCAHSAAAQDQAPPAARLFAGAVVNDTFPQVTVPLFVVDANGLPVTDLLPEELNVSEDGRAVPTSALVLEPAADAPLHLMIALNRATPPADWDSVIAGINLLLDELQPGDSVGVVAFNEVAETLIAPTAELDAVRAALVNAPAGGTQSSLLVALNQALGLFTDADGRRALLIVSDRGDTAAAGGDETVLPALIEAAHQAGIAAHSIVYGTNGPSPAFAQLASGTGGRAIAVTGAGDVAPHLQALPALLRQGYHLGYVSALPANDSEHLLSIGLRSVAEGAPLERTLVARSRPVTVTITHPAHGQQVSGSVVVAFSAATPAPVRRVTFALDTGEIITSTESALGGIVWDSSSAPAGARRLSVAVEDSAGNVGKDEVELTVVPPILLSVALSETEVVAGRAAAITATVKSVLSPATVEAFVGRTQVGVEANTQGDVPFLVDTSPFPPGRYGIFVRATDAQGHSVTDNAQVLTLAAPPNPNLTPTGAWAVVQAWFARWWLWLVGGLLSLILLWLLWLIGRALARAFQRQRAARVAVRARVVPQMRMLIANTGNSRTRYRLRAEAPGSDLAFTFLLDGVPLPPPLVARVAGGAPLTNGRAQPLTGAMPAAPAPAVTAAPALAGAAAGPAAAAHSNAAAAQHLAGGAAQVADVGGRFFSALGQLLPGNMGDTFRSAGNTVKTQQATVARAQGDVFRTLDDADDVRYYGQQLAPGARPAAQPGTPAPAAPPPAAPKPAPVNKAYALQPEANGRAPSGAVAAAASSWVETPPVAPGETLGVDIYVAPLRRMARNARVSFNVYSGPANAEDGPLTTDTVSVSLNGAR